MFTLSRELTKIDTLEREFGISAVSFAISLEILQCFSYVELKVTFRGSSLQDRRLGVGDFGGRVGLFSSSYSRV